MTVGITIIVIAIFVFFFSIRIVTIAMPVFDVKRGKLSFL